MLFNSFNYFIFLPVVFVIYYLLPDRMRWILILLASIFFYLKGSATTIFVPLIIIISTFICGLLIDRTPPGVLRKTCFQTGLLINIGLLVFYKYVNFIISSVFDGYYFIDQMLFDEHNSHQPSIILHLVIPLGISFITFQAIGYLIEIYRGSQSTEKNLGLFSTYLLFFPKLISGPIERAHSFLPQMRQKHSFNYDLIVKGLKRILWGLFLKLVVSDRIAIYTDAVYSNAEHHSGITLLAATLLFSVQLFTDFAGYTHLAIGSANILGYQLMENFNRPFFATSITDFWRRWHISLTTWVNEYIFNPIVIKFRNWNKVGVIFALIITFLIVGFWHGASWNFLIFGFLHGIIITIEFLTRKVRKNIQRDMPNWVKTLIGISFTFVYFSFSVIFFKANTASEAFHIIKKIFTFNGPLYIGTPSIIIYSLFGILFLILADLVQIFSHGEVSFFNNQNGIIRKLSYAVVIIIILLIGVFDGGQFIYFQF